jgi:hypothetical protein
MPREHKLTVRMSDKQYKAAKVKCVSIERPLSEVVRDLLAGWVDGSITLPQPTEPKAKAKRGKT